MANRPAYGAGGPGSIPAWNNSYTTLVENLSFGVYFTWHDNGTSTIPQRIKRA